MVTSVRCKMKCMKKTEFEHDSYEVLFQPVYGDSPENKRFWEATPSGELRLSGIKKPVADLYEVGKSYYLDTTPTGAS